MKLPIVLSLVFCLTFFMSSAQSVKRDSTYNVYSNQLNYSQSFDIEELMILTAPNTQSGRFISSHKALMSNYNIHTSSYTQNFISNHSVNTSDELCDFSTKLYLPPGTEIIHDDSQGGLITMDYSLITN